MTQVEVYEKLNSVFRDVFDDDKLVVDDSTTAMDVQGWDSLMQVTLISEIEDVFEIQFNMNEILKFKNVGEMADKIMELL